MVRLQIIYIRDQISFKHLDLGNNNISIGSSKEQRYSDDLLAIVAEAERLGCMLLVGCIRSLGAGDLVTDLKLQGSVVTIENEKSQQNHD